MTIGTFVTSTLGMNSQAHAIEQISANIANVNTIGYKKINTRFETFMKEYNEMGVNTNYFSANALDRRMVDLTGEMKPTESLYDLAISGRGFFVVEGTGNTYYSRAGDFQPTAYAPPGRTPKTVTYQRPADGGPVTQSTPATYFMNSSGFYVMGWNYDAGTEAYSSSMEPVIISPMEYYIGHPTTQMTFKGNIDAAATTTQILRFEVYDSSYNQHNMLMKWSPQHDAGTWLVNCEIDGAAVTSEPIKVTFDSEGRLTSPVPSSQINVTWDSGETASIDLDMQLFTQFADTLNGNVLSQDGNGYGKLISTSWDAKGVLTATYTNGTTIPVCKVAVAQVQVPNMMEAVSGNMFAYHRDAGKLEIIDLQETKTETMIEGGTRETSNVSLEEEFTNMIISQRAYSSNVQTFTTVNEMTQEAISILS